MEAKNSKLPVETVINPMYWRTTTKRTKSGEQSDRQSTSNWSASMKNACLFSFFLLTFFFFSFFFFFVLFVNPAPVTWLEPTNRKLSLPNTWFIHQFCYYRIILIITVNSCYSLIHSQDISLLVTIAINYDIVVDSVISSIAAFRSTHHVEYIQCLTITLVSESGGNQP